MIFAKRADKWLLVGGSAAAIFWAGGCGAPEAVSPPLAMVNGQVITEQEWSTAVRATAMLAGNPPPAIKTPSTSQISALIQQQAVKQWGLAHQVTNSTAAGKAAQALIAALIKKVGGPTAWQAMLKRYGLNPGSLMPYLTEQMILQSVYDRNTHNAPSISTAAVKKYYQAHRSDFVTPPLVEARQIVVKQQSQAESLLKQIRHGGNFAALARRDSIDASSAKAGGSLGWVPLGVSAAKGGVSSGLAKALKTLRQGQFGIVHTQSGYHIVEVEAKQSGSPVPLAKVSSAISTQLLINEKATMFQKWATGIEKTAKVQRY